MSDLCLAAMAISTILSICALVWLAITCNRQRQVLRETAGYSIRLVMAPSSCPCRELHPAILMMKSAEKRPRGEVTKPLNGPTVRRILVQRQMRSEFVVIDGVGCACRKPYPHGGCP